MTGPDPAVAATRSAVRSVLAEVPEQGTVVVACSGGADSLALLAATTFESRAGGHPGRWRVVGATVDHSLQPGSAEQAARVVAQMADLGADETVTVTVSVDAAGLGPEAAARQARYAALDALAENLGAAVVLLGHTRDDQAETVLLGLARGSGGRSIAGMRRGFDRYRRPLLDLARADTRAAVDALGLTAWDDPHNEDPAFARVRVRDRVLPVLETELGPGVAKSLARTADLIRADMEYLDDVAAQVLAGLPALDVAALAPLATPVRRRVLRSAALAAGVPPAELAHEHVVGIDDLVVAWRGQVGVDLPGHLRAVRRDGVLEFEDTAPDR